MIFEWSKASRLSKLNLMLTLAMIAALSVSVPQFYRTLQQVLVALRVIAPSGNSGVQNPGQVDAVTLSNILVIRTPTYDASKDPDGRMQTAFQFLHDHLNKLGGWNRWAVDTQLDFRKPEDRPEQKFMYFVAIDPSKDAAAEADSLRSILKSSFGPPAFVSTIPLATDQAVEVAKLLKTTFFASASPEGK